MLETTEDVDPVAEAVVTASRVLVGVAARSLAATADQVTLPQFRMLVVLVRRGPLRAGELADALAVHPSTATRMTDRLYGAGYVERSTNPGNRREVILAATAGARRLVAEVTGRRHAEITGIVAAMPARQRTRLVAALEAFNQAAGEPAGGDEVPLGWG